MLFKEFKLLCFDPAFGEGLGLRMRALDRLLMLMVVTNVAIGLQAVGVVLMSALLITPAAAARYWTERLDVMVILAALFGGLSGVAGTFISLAGPKLATGPLIVLAASLLFLVSLTFGTPARSRAQAGAAAESAPQSRAGKLAARSCTKRSKNKRPGRRRPERQHACSTTTGGR